MDNSKMKQGVMIASYSGLIAQIKTKTNFFEKKYFLSPKLLALIFIH